MDPGRYSQIAQTLVFWGTYDRGKPRVRLLLQGATLAGYQVIECHHDVWSGVEDKSQLRSKFWYVLKILLAYPRLIVRYLRLPRHDAVVVPYLGQFDLLLLWPFARLRRTVLYWDAFLSLYDTCVNDRALFSKHSLRAWLLYTVEWINCRLADHVFLDTPAHASYFEELFHLRVGSVRSVIVGAEDLFFRSAEAKLEIPDKPLEVLFYGQFIPLHGLETIVAAAKLVGEANSQIHFTIIGTGQEEEKIASMLIRNSVRNVTRISWVSYQELTRYLQQADLVLGIFGKSRKAQIVVPNKVYQALAAGRPIITGDTEAMKELVGSDKLLRLVPPGNPDALASAILEFATARRDNVDKPQSIKHTQPISAVEVGRQLQAVING